MYVVMPVPASVRAAITPAAAPRGRCSPAIGRRACSRRIPLPDGQWEAGSVGQLGGGGMNWRYGNRRCGPTQLEGCSPQWNQTMDFEFEAPSRFGPNRPLYKPEHWDKVQRWTCGRTRKIRS